MDTKKTIKQHFVSQFYLKSWAQSDEMINIKGNGKPFKSNSKNVGHENHLYRIEGIGEQEAEILLKGTKKISESMRVLFELLIEACHAFKILSLLPKDEETNKKIDIEQQNIIERFYGVFEDQVQTSYNILVTGEYDKFDINHYQDILRFVALQLTRTPKVKETSTISMQDILAQRGIQFSDFNTLHSAIISEQLTTALIERLYQVEIIENLTELNFITSDNPVKNLLPEKDVIVNLYWPITPKKALIVKPTNFTPEQAQTIKNGILKEGKQAEYLIRVTQINEREKIESLNHITWNNKHRHIYFLEDRDIASFL